jgi:GH35 family endo-1,4-beta-xylanase
MATTFIGRERTAAAGILPVRWRAGKQNRKGIGGDRQRFLSSVAFGVPPGHRDVIPASTRSPQDVKRLLFSIAPALVALGSLAAELSVPPGGEEISAGGKPGAYANPAHGTSKHVEGVWRIDITKPDDSRPFVAQFSMSCPQGELVPGDLVLAIIKARATRGGSPSVEAKLQLATAPYTAAANTTGIDLTADWRELPVLFPVTTALEKGAASVNLLCGRRSQTVEIASIRAFKYPAGTDTSAFPRIRKTYAGREPDAPWRKAALERIEQHRKAELSLRVAGPDGKPLADTEVILTLRRHEFGFGSAVTAGFLTAETEDGKRYREIVDRLFSQIVFENDLKDFGWQEGAKNKEAKLKQLDQAMSWLEQRQISIRAHYLMQVAAPPNLAQVKDPEAIRQHFLTTAEERLAFPKDRVCEWDVINHPVAWGGADLLNRRPGLEKLDREVYRLAQRATPVPLIVNEDQLFRPGRQSDETFEYVRQLKTEGFRVDGVGNQAHVDESFLPTPEHVLAVTDRFATLVPRQVITEFDITTLQDEELAADYTRDLMIACFSHPAYTGFLLWGFWEGRHWKPEAASWNQDWTIRKRGEVLEEWIGRRWNTTVTLTTGNEGDVRWRGFPGWYEVANKAGEKIATVEVTRQASAGK